jgi:hypothetical protein
MLRSHYARPPMSTRVLDILKHTVHQVLAHALLNPGVDSDHIVFITTFHVVLLIDVTKT